MEMIYWLMKNMKEKSRNKSLRSKFQATTIKLKLQLNITVSAQEPAAAGECLIAFQSSLPQNKSQIIYCDENPNPENRN